MDLMFRVSLPDLPRYLRQGRLLSACHTCILSGTYRRASAAAQHRMGCLPHLTGPRCGALLATFSGPHSLEKRLPRSLKHGYKPYLHSAAQHSRAVTSCSSVFMETLAQTTKQEPLHRAFFPAGKSLRHATTPRIRRTHFHIVPISSCLRIVGVLFKRSYCEVHRNS